MKSGYGLGLTIAKQVMQVHKGSIFAALRPEGGLIVTLNLPLDNLSSNIPGTSLK
jgi:signal transduction histidine kinase